MINQLYQKPFPVLIIDEKYILREQSPADVEDFFEYYTQDPMVTQYILATVPATVADATSEIQYCRNLFYHSRGIYWALARRDNNKIIGAAGLYINNHHHRAELCYDLAQAYWRQGIMGKVVAKILNFVFNDTEINRLEAVTLKENQGSNGLLQKSGFTLEGSLCNYRYYKQQSHDIEMYGISRETYHATHQNQTHCQTAGHQKTAEVLAAA